MNVDVVPDTAEAMDTTAIPTAEKRKPLSVRQSKAKRQKPKTTNAGEERISGRPIHNHQTIQSKKSKRKATTTTSIRSNHQHPQRQQDTQRR